MTAHPVSIAAPDAPLAGHGTACPSGGTTVFPLAEAVRRLERLRPAPAYRLSVDSGIEYKNVRRALEQPGAARVATWCRLLQSLRLRMVAARCAEDVIRPGGHTGIVALCAGARAPASVGLRALRMQAGLSRRALARRAGIATDTVRAGEEGHGTLGSVERLCRAHGLQVLLVLPPGHASLEDLWREQSQRCLQAPAHYRLGRGTLAPDALPR